MSLLQSYLLWQATISKVATSHLVTTYHVTLVVVPYCAFHTSKDLIYWFHHLLENVTPWSQGPYLPCSLLSLGEFSACGGCSVRMCGMGESAWASRRDTGTRWCCRQASLGEIQEARVKSLSVPVDKRPGYWVGGRCWLSLILLLQSIKHTHPLRAPLLGQNVSSHSSPASLLHGFYPLACTAGSQIPKTSTSGSSLVPRENNHLEPPGWWLLIDWAPNIPTGRGIFLPGRTLTEVVVVSPSRDLIKPHSVSAAWPSLTPPRSLPWLLWFTWVLPVPIAMSLILTCHSFTHLLIHLKIPI